VKSKKFRTRISGSNPEVPDRNLRNFRNRTTVKSRVELRDFPGQNLQNIQTGTSGTFGLEPLELQDQNLQNFQTVNFRTS
jgi:hypothetical protein